VLFPVFTTHPVVLGKGTNPYFRHTLQKAFKPLPNETNHRNGIARNSHSGGTRQAGNTGCISKS
jgi:hypothetical protein